VVASLVQMVEFFHEKDYAMTELQPGHLIVEKTSGRVKVTVSGLFSCCRSLIRCLLMFPIRIILSLIHPCIRHLKFSRRTKCWQSQITIPLDA